PIQGYGDDYVTGICSDGRQVVMGLLCPQVVGYFFDSEGKLLGDEHRPWNTHAPRMRTNGPYRLYDDNFRAALEVQLLEWQSDIGFRPATIHVRAFLDPRHPVGIEQLPEHLRNFETDEGCDEDERKELSADKDEWIAEGKFVWNWAKDYWVDS